MGTIWFGMLMIAAGSEDGDDDDPMRRDPKIKLALDQLVWMRAVLAVRGICHELAGPTQGCF